ncbi:MAG: hypothetical protein QXW47_05630 [Candidatus Jordarchaeales archaeon]
MKSTSSTLSGLADWIVEQTGEIKVGWGGVNVSIPVSAGQIVGIATKQNKPGGSFC